MKFKEFFIPQEKKFFEMINQQAAKIQGGVVLLQELLNDFTHIEQKRAKLKEVEHEADKLVHNIFYELNSTFITPIDREDIAELTSGLDDIMDNTYAAANRIYLYEISEPTKAMKELVQCLRTIIDQLVIMLSKFQDLKNSRETNDFCIEINRLENVADEIYTQALAELFKGKDSIQIMKLKEIYEYLENATDSCEDVANTISDILVKNS